MRTKAHLSSSTAGNAVTFFARLDIKQIYLLLDEHYLKNLPVIPNVGAGHARDFCFGA